MCRIIPCLSTQAHVFHVYVFFTLLLSSFWTSRGHRCRPFSPPCSSLHFFSRIGFSNPPSRRVFKSSLSNSRSPAFRKLICDQKKSLLFYKSMHSEGLDLTNLTCTRGQPGPPPGRSAFISTGDYPVAEYHNQWS